MRLRFYIDVLDHMDGSKNYHVCDGGQTVCTVSEHLFDNPNDARVWANAIAAALNNRYADHGVTTCRCRCACEWQQDVSEEGLKDAKCPSCGSEEFGWSVYKGDA